MREAQPGVDLLLDVQVFDVRACAPLRGVRLDFWHANATGAYSGVAAEGTRGLTFLRGLAATDAAGVAQLTTKFPGHYRGACAPPPPPPPAPAAPLTGQAARCTST